MAVRESWFYRRVPPFRTRPGAILLLPPAGSLPAEQCAALIERAWRARGHDVQITFATDGMAGRVVRSNLIAGLPPAIWSELWTAYEASRQRRGGAR